MVTPQVTSALDSLAGAEHSGALSPFTVLEAMPRLCGFSKTQEERSVAAERHLLTGCE